MANACAAADKRLGGVEFERKMALTPVHRSSATCWSSSTSRCAAESVQTLAANGATELVECGPGKVLAGLNKRCAEGVSTANLNTPDAFAARAALA